MGFRASCPKIWYLGILNIWVEGIWEMQVQERLRWHPLLEAGDETLTWQVPSLHSEERSILISVDGGIPGGIRGNLPCCFPSLLPLAHTLFFYHFFFLHGFPLFIQFHIITLGLSASSGLHFLRKAPMSHKTMVNEVVGFSVVHPLSGPCQGP